MESQQILLQVISVFCHQAALTRSHVSTKQRELIPSWPLPLEQRARTAITWIQTGVRSVLFFCAVYQPYI